MQDKDESLRARTALALAAVVVAAAVLAYRSGSFWVGDYPNDAGPVIDKLIHGDIGGFLSGQALMGPVSLLLRAPFAALSLVTGGGGVGDLYDAAYRFGVFPCALAGGLLGVLLFRRAEREQRRPLVRYGALVLCTVNPVTLKAIEYGHPEEILAAVLVVGAMLAALRERAMWAAILLVLAIATKQWALLAVPSVAVALPWRSLRRPLLVLAGLAVLAAIPLVAADPSGFVKTNLHLLDVRSGNVGPGSIWWAVTSPVASDPSGRTHVTPDWLGLLSHPGIILMSLVVPLALARRVRADLLQRALPLLALVLLLRATLDPVNNSYYHVPFFLALVAADVVVGSLSASLVATAGLLLVIQIDSAPLAQATIYALWSLATATYLAGRAYGLDWAGVLRSRGARGLAVATPPHSSAAAAGTPEAR